MAAAREHDAADGGDQQQEGRDLEGQQEAGQQQLPDVARGAVGVWPGRVAGAVGVDGLQTSSQQRDQQLNEHGARQEGPIPLVVPAGLAVAALALLLWRGDPDERRAAGVAALVGGGAAIFGLVIRRQLGDRLRRPLAHLLFFSLLFAFLGGSSILHGAPPGTRFDVVMKVAVTVALIGAVTIAMREKKEMR